MKKSILIGAMAVLASGIASTAALASTVTATISGTMLNGTDFNGLFFAAGTDMTGQTVNLTYQFNTAAGTVTPFGTGDWLFGDGSATLTLNGHSEFILNNQTANPTDAAFDDSSALLDLFVNHTDAGIESQVEATLISPLSGSGLPATIFDSYAQTTCPVGLFSCQGSFSISPTGTAGLSGSFKISAFQYDVSTVAATPIPPALPLFVSALGGLGFLGWRRRVTTA